jgi:thymidylate kinase
LVPVLALYETFFRALTDHGVGYSVFKSLEHLTADLAGERGDVDVWVDSADAARLCDIAVQSGFFTVRWSPTSGVAFILIGWDIPSGAKVLLHVHRYPIAVKKRSYLPLYFLYNAVPDKTIKDSFPAQALEAWCDRFEADRSALKSKSTLRLLGLALFRRSAIEALGFRFSMRETARIFVTYFHRFILLRGRYRIARGGMLVALSGVDGSGKTSVVDSLGSSSFLRTSQGVKLSYFGNKGFWMPGLHRALLKYRKANLPGVFFMTLSLVDRKLRIVPALLAKARGRIVIADRYFYDQNIFDPTENYFKNRALKAVVNPIVSWIPAIPRVTFYLQVPAKVAFSRKQDYEFSKVERTTAAYDAYLVGRPEVRVIDATQPLDAVLADVRTELLAQLRAKHRRR